MTTIAFNRTYERGLFTHINQIGKNDLSVVKENGIGYVQLFFFFVAQVWRAKSEAKPKS